MSARAHASTRERPYDPTATAERLFAENRRRLLAIARGHCSSPDDAEEALQDALVLFIEHFDPASGSPPLPWLMLTLKRRCWAIYGRRRQLGELLAALGEEAAVARERRTVEDLAEINERARALRRRMQALPLEEQRALTLLASGHSYAEIAERFGSTPKRIDHALQRARATLRKSGDGQPAPSDG